MKLKFPRTVSLTSLVIGAILIIFARVKMHQVNKAKGTIDHMTDFFTNGSGMWDPVIKFFGGQVHAQASKYDTTLSALFFIGIVLVALGAIGLFWPKRK